MKQVTYLAGLLRCFGKTLEHCPSCGSLQIHSLFAENEEDFALRLNLGGCSPVLCHNVFKTCESKGDDIDCRLVILGARPRSSAAHAVLSEHTGPSSTFCQDCHYQSPDPHSNHQPDDAHPLPNSYDHYPSFYEASSEKSTSQHDQSKAGSSHNSTEVSLFLDKVVSYGDPVASTSHLFIEGSSHLKRILPLPSSLQSGTPPVLYSVANSVSYEHARETAGSTQKSPPSVGTEDVSCDARKYANSSQCESNLSQVHSLAICESGQTCPLDTSSYSNIEPNVVSPFKGDNAKTQKKRTLNVLNETEQSVPAKRHDGKVSSVRSLDEMNVRNAYCAKDSNSIILNYSEPRESGAIVKTECADASVSMTIAEETSKSPIRIQPYFAPISLQGAKLMGEGPSSAGIQADAADRESLSNNIDANASHVASPTTDSERTKDGLGKFADSQETGSVTGKAGTDAAYSKVRSEQKDSVSRWSNRDVISFLKGTDCGEYSDVFVQEVIVFVLILIFYTLKNRRGYLHESFWMDLSSAMHFLEVLDSLKFKKLLELQRKG